MVTQTVSRLSLALPFVKREFDTTCVARRSLRQSAADTPLARWLVDYGESRGWETGRQAAKYLGVKQAAFSTWLRGEMEPDRANQEQLAVGTGEPLSVIADLVRRTKEQKRALAGDAASPIPARPDQPPAWARDLMAAALEIRRLVEGARAAGQDFGLGHAGVTAPARADAARPLLEAEGYRGLIPVEVGTEDLLDHLPPVAPGMIVWLDPLLP